MMKNSDTFICQATMDKLDEIIAFIGEGSRRFGFDEMMQQKIHLVSEEVAANVINYAYPGSSGTLEVRYMIEKDQAPSRFVLQFIDHGLAFNPLEASDPNIDAPVEERSIGGLGIFLVKKIMDEVTYKRENNQNILTLVKY
ncbi:ATP-binding protein [bacterium]|nr:ATP-binding protein [bacterium]